MQTKGDSIMSTANLNAGKALRVLMAEQNVTSTELSKALGVSMHTVTILRKKELMTGRQLLALSDYFGISAADFIKKGER